MTPRASGPTVAAVVPAHNEGRRVAATVRALRDIPGLAEVIVVDDGSDDATGEEAASAGARVIRLERNRGKGYALRHGVAASAAEVILFVDADLEESARNLAMLVAPVAGGDADVAVAAPPSDGGPSGFGMVEGLARWGIRRKTGRTMVRPLSGQRAVRRAVLDGLGGFAGGFGVETGFTLDALRAGYRVVEVPCEIRHARTGRDLAGFLHRGRQGLDVLRALGGSRRAR